jgi:hypothetical protein
MSVYYAYAIGSVYTGVFFIFIKLKKLPTHTAAGFDLTTHYSAGGDVTIM